MPRLRFAALGTLAIYSMVLCGLALTQKDPNPLAAILAAVAAALCGLGAKLAHDTKETDD